MKKYVSVIMAAAVLAIIFVPAVSVSADTGDASMLIDMGNGTTYWCEITTTGSYYSITKVCAESLGLDVTSSGDSISKIGDMSDHSVGGQTCKWNLYIWNTDTEKWNYCSDMSSSYSEGYFAVGFYPDTSIVPAETPDNPTAWTVYGGDSSASNCSDSYGTDSAATPVEWYKTYSTGYVDSAIIVAGNYLYHTTGGTYGATGSDKDPWVYCIDRNTGMLVWSYHMAYGQGYEVTSPLVVGDMLIVTATNGNVYCFDRYGDGNGNAVVLDILALDLNYPIDSNGDITWEGRTFYTGGTTPIYDSGAIYFGTSDGHVLCYSLTSEGKFVELWDYNPSSSIKGCFYFHAPVIADINGVRMLFIGSYEGFVYALNASTGDEIWASQAIDLGDVNKPHPGTPGSAGSISVTSEGKLLVCCSDGGLSSLTGYLLCMDAATGKSEWKLDFLCNDPVVVGDYFYTYVSPVSGGASTLTGVDGTEYAVTNAVYKFDLNGNVVWVTENYQMIKASLTYADGVLYAMDYSAGIFYPTGGGLTAINAEDGSQSWRIKLTPYSSGSYSMVSPTVIDGKIYVGNDYGAIYCISDVQGQAYGDSGEIVLSNGFYHWSWILLIIIVVVAFAFLIKFY